MIKMYISRKGQMWPFHSEALVECLYSEKGASQLVPVQSGETRGHQFNSLYFTFLFILFNLGHEILEELMN